MKLIKEMFPNHPLETKWDFEQRLQFTADDMKEFATEVAKQALKNASENVKILDANDEVIIIKSSITTENNIPKL